ncbi:hypothetical protein CSKR_105452 [Clonorchis sinensis]|uniref:Uncharacterized protein n=1 Tax=Clonorchis sinensis TaxID=79923 RepID=A0A3R7CBR7_CLOSI|nr:hypothetical protein CSKR_105452 [Clonorchis sinensis]
MLHKSRDHRGQFWHTVSLKLRIVFLLPVYRDRLAGDPNSEPICFVFKFLQTFNRYFPVVFLFTYAHKVSAQGIIPRSHFTCSILAAYNAKDFPGCVGIPAEHYTAMSDPPLSAVHHSRPSPLKADRYLMDFIISPPPSLPDIEFPFDPFHHKYSSIEKRLCTRHTKFTPPTCICPPKDTSSLLSPLPKSAHRNNLAAWNLDDTNYIFTMSKHACTVPPASQAMGKTGDFTRHQVPLFDTSQRQHTHRDAKVQMFST